MKHFISTFVLMAAVVAAPQAQDTTATTRTQVKADDATAVSATGCLIAGVVPGSFALRGGVIARGNEVTTTSRVETNVDKDETRVKAETSTKADGDRERVRAGGVTLFDLSPRAGVELASHVGHRVELMAVMLDRGKGDANVTIKEETKVDRENGRDSNGKTETKIDLERGRGNPRLTVLSVKQLATSCVN